MKWTVKHRTDRNTDFLAKQSQFRFVCSLFDDHYVLCEWINLVSGDTAGQQANDNVQVKDKTRKRKKKSKVAGDNKKSAKLDAETLAPVSSVVETKNEDKKSKKKKKKKKKPTLQVDETGDSVTVEVEKQQNDVTDDNSVDLSEMTAWAEFNVPDKILRALMDAGYFIYIFSSFFSCFILFIFEIFIDLFIFSRFLAVNFYNT